MSKEKYGLSMIQTLRYPKLKENHRVYNKWYKELWWSIVEFFSKDKTNVGQ